MGREATWLPPEPVRAFLARLPDAPARALLLDYDGTLAPFRVERQQARPYPAAAEILARMLSAGHTRIVLVTGRPVEQVLELLDRLPVPEIWGVHGWERRMPDGRRADVAPDPTALGQLDEAWRAVQTAALRGRAERKRTTIALHWRGLPPERIADVRERARVAWTEVLESGRFDLREFDGGLELRLRGRSKGDAVATIAEEQGPGVLLAYLGDDDTDEDAFAVVPAGGLGVLVRDRARPTRAQAWLRPPEELVAFLAAWHRCLAPPGR